MRHILALSQEPIMIGRRSHDDAQSFEEAWNGRTPRDEHIAGLVRFAEDLCESAAAEPSPNFRSSLRAQLMTEAATVLVPMPATAPQRVTAPTRARPVRRRIAAATAAIVASAGVVGIVASSASAVPGEMLYPVKRSVETVELQLHRDDASRGSFQLAQASERLAEAKSLSDDGRPDDLIAKTLEQFSASATDGSGSLFNAFGSTGQEKSIREVNDFAAASSVDLSVLSSQLPDGVADSFAAATTAVTDLATEASVLCSSCAPADVQALVSAVTDLTKKSAAPAKVPAKADSTQPSTVPAKAKTPTSAAPPTPHRTPAASATPVAPVLPTLPVKTPALTGLTDPLLGGLLGNEDQVGLVPGLLNGLLGTPAPPK